ncbi:RagB/SusD family nutrient uptake outer membrane protein [Niabella sp. CJ426]|uniref:RagB/SusD family nutrient uptake outer membrane protein n=1 Tax=Niabella sp. CJ426 TaxID=3393740 RepID=UPI003D080ED2
MKSIIKLITGILLLTAASCKKFLAEYSQNQTFIESASDLDELLVGMAYAPGLTVSWAEQDLLDDDMEQNPPVKTVSSYNLFGVHNWQRMPSIQDDGKFNSSYGESYGTLYKRIAALNTILYNVRLLLEKGGPEKQLQRIAGESHFLRAYFYLVLANTYGKPYRIATAGTDYSVPLKVTPDVELKYFSRATVQQVYDQVEADLLDAEKELEGMNSQSVIRANQAATQALLSRVYLYMEQYEKTQTYANKVLQKQYRLRDMNGMAAGSYFNIRLSSETIFTLPHGPAYENDPLGIADIMRINLSATSPNNYRVSEDLLNIYSNRDLRLQWFFIKTDQGDWLVRKSGDLYDWTTIRLPELYLNQAEALAAQGFNAEAIKVLQALRKNRFTTEDLTTVQLNGAGLVNFIREERRRELCFEQHRWFDLRRYGVNSKYPFGKTIRHRSFAYDNDGRYIQGYYELKPYAQDEAAYVLPIPEAEVEFNKGEITNEPRPERPLITGD